MSSLAIKNKKARFNYEIVDTLVVGLQLTGTEIKSIREGKVNINDAFLVIRNDELILINAHISPYSHGNRENHDPTRSRKCLAHKQEILKLKVYTEEKGLTLVPLKLFMKKQWLKCEIGVGRGKKLHDKRATQKERDLKRETDQAIKRIKR